MIAHITIKDLAEKGVCKQALRMFKANYGDSVSVGVLMCDMLISDKFKGYYKGWAVALCILFKLPVVLDIGNECAISGGDAFMCGEDGKPIFHVVHPRLKAWGYVADTLDSLRIGYDLDLSMASAISKGIYEY